MPMSKEILDRDDFIDRLRARDQDARAALFEYGRTNLLPINIKPSRGLFHEDAEDIVEEVSTTFIKSGCPSYKKRRGPFSHYFARIVTVAGHYYQRQRSRLKLVYYDEDSETPRELFTRTIENLSGEPEDGDLGKYLNLTSEKNGVALTLWFVESKSVEIIAEELGITQSAVRKRISRGIDDLKTQLKGTDPREIQTHPGAIKQRKRRRA